MITYSFPEEFLWGAATSAFQIEGSLEADGRSESIWERYCSIPGMVANGHNGQTACDHFKRYKEDIKLMKELGLKSYRFSLAWPRIIPGGTGKVNERGLAFYEDLIGLLLEARIKPMITIYHWDLPQVLQDRGGWGNRDSISWYEDYAGVVLERFGKQVPYWLTHNEPFIVANCGHFWGTHAPGFQDPALAFQVGHHVMVSHGRVVRNFRKMGLPGEIGITIDNSAVVPASDNPGDLAAASRKDQFRNLWYLEALFKGEYPRELACLIKERGFFPEIREGDFDLITEPLNFLGMNYYTRSLTRYDDTEPFLASSWDIPQLEVTEMDWEVYPPGIYQILKRADKISGGMKLMVTENGAAFKDQPDEKGFVQDDRRLAYLKGHFENTWKAMQEGVKVEGYYIWSLLDNFEWGYGYDKRFGIVRVDFSTQERVPKASALWYKEVIRRRGF